MTLQNLKLGDLKRGDQGVIVKVGRNEEDLAQISRLLEMGFLEGATVEVLHEAPFGNDPIAVKVRGSLVALRRSEANAIEVTLL